MPDSYVSIHSTTIVYLVIIESTKLALKNKPNLNSNKVYNLDNKERGWDNNILTILYSIEAILTSYNDTTNIN